MTKRKICVVTGTRAEYGLFFPIMKKIHTSQNLELQIVATTMHLSEEFGLSYQQIIHDGFTIDRKVENLLSSDSKSSIAKSTGLAIILLSDVFQQLQPDIILLLGDRFETHAAATTAMLMNIPIAHIHGGEISEGAVDEQIRHSISKMAYLHFTATQEYRQRVIQLGEHPDRVFCTGAPGLDNILKMSLLDKKSLEKELQFKFIKPVALFTFHPETLSTVDIRKQTKTILHTIDSLGIHVLFTYANADDGGRIINRMIENFVSCNPKKYCVVKNLGTLKYLSAMKYVDLLIGNTSSGIIEAASFNKPVVNIGNRQQGRLQSGNVINSSVSQLGASINKALSDNFINKCKMLANIYGNGNASENIIQQLEKYNFCHTKQFFNL